MDKISEILINEHCQTKALQYLYDELLTFKSHSRDAFTQNSRDELLAESQTYWNVLKTSFEIMSAEELKEVYNYYKKLRKGLDEIAEQYKEANHFECQIYSLEHIKKIIIHSTSDIDFYYSVIDNALEEIKQCLDSKKIETKSKIANIINPNNPEDESKSTM